MSSVPQPQPASGFKQLTPQVWVSGQIDGDDLRRAAAAGVRVVVNNRPDGESPDQTPGVQIAQAAGELGLRYVYAPVAGRPDETAISLLREAIAGADGPVLVYCRSGARSVMVWALAEASSGAPRDTIRAQAAACGYDLSGWI